MSHIEKISNVEITDLSILKKACDNLGLELDITKKTYKSAWTDELECSAVIVGKQNGEAALVQTDSGYEIQWDNYHNSLAEVIGDKCEILCREYTTEAVIQQANTVGMVDSVETQEDGSVILQGVYL